MIMQTLLLSIKMKRSKPSTEYGLLWWPLKALRFQSLSPSRALWKHRVSSKVLVCPPPQQRASPLPELWVLMRRCPRHSPASLCLAVSFLVQASLWPEKDIRFQLSLSLNILDQRSCGFCPNPFDSVIIRPLWPSLRQTEASFKVESKVYSEILLELFSKLEQEPSTWGVSPWGFHLHSTLPWIT